jgi:5'-deoxynucleotidase YfbR-like HD superfamily hydrolase
MASLNIVPEFALWALLHDASEAYVPDIASPIKPWISGFKEIEDNILKAVAAKFGLVWPMPDAVHEIDSILLLTERRDVMLPTKLPWAQISFKAKGLKPLEAKIKPWSWRRAEKKFLSRFEELAGEAKQEAPVDYAKVKALRGGVKPVEEADDDDTFVCLSPTKASQVSLHDPAECLPRAGSCKTYEPNRLRLYGDKAGRWDNVVRALEEDR